jgi:hypothetical protein
MIDARLTLRSIWKDGDEVIGNDSQVVAVDTELLHAFCSSIDQAKSMSLAGSEFETAQASVAHTRRGISSSNCGAVEVVAAIDEIII